ncbi:hypothetical protein WJX82_004130 [Trebouxia sp. C0006]
MRQLDERSALAALLKAADASEPAAVSRLGSLVKFIKMTNPPNCCRWWSHMDNNILLREYDKRGVYLHRKNRQAVRAFAEDLIADSFSSVDFTVQATVRMCDTQFEAFKTFLIDQLKVLMEGLMDPALV